MQVHKKDYNRILMEYVRALSLSLLLQVALWKTRVSYGI